MGLLRNAWMLAIETLSWMEMQRLTERSALAKTVRQLGIEDSDAIRFAYRLVCEANRRRNLLDRFINNVVGQESIDDFDLGLQSFMRLYVYQTRMARKWSGFDIEEAENIVKVGRSVLGWEALQKVESILGLLLVQEPVKALEGTTDEERTGLLTFHPTWFVKYCFNLFDRREALAMLKANVHTPLTYIRLSTLKANESSIVERLIEDGVTVEKIEQLKYVYRIQNAKIPLTRTSSYNEGLFYVQDMASSFAAEVADPQPGMTILDVCAAPGAKTTYLAQLMQNNGIIYSVDYSRRRMNIWRGEVERMGAKIAEPIIADARYPSFFTKKANIVTLDPPCTGTGTFARLPSAKWRLTPRSIAKMAEIQWQMLNNCAECVEQKGGLIYSTCSITIEENEMLIERFLKWHPEFALGEMTPRIGLPGLRGLDSCRRFYPHIHHCNGFFAAKLVKIRT